MYPELSITPELTRAVHKIVATIPSGKVATYGQVAEALGSPEASRAIGQANNRNPIPIIIPCHRVIGRDGSLTGYGGGLEVKEYLLRLESDVVCGRLRFCPED